MPRPAAGPWVDQDGGDTGGGGGGGWGSQRGNDNIINININIEEAKDEPTG